MVCLVLVVIKAADQAPAVTYIELLVPVSGLPTQDIVDSRAGEYPRSTTQLGAAGGLLGADHLFTEDFQWYSYILHSTAVV